MRPDCRLAGDDRGIRLEQGRVIGVEGYELLKVLGRLRPGDFGLTQGALIRAPLVLRGEAQKETRNREKHDDRDQ